MTEVKDIDFDAYIRDEDDVVDYYEYEGVIDSIDSNLRANENLLQIGPSGVGKTQSFVYYAMKRDIPVVVVSCSKDIKDMDMNVKPWTEYDEANDVERTVYIAGHYIIAIKAANEFGNALLVLDEINNLPSRHQKKINNMGDWREGITLPELNKRFSLDDECNLLIGGTMVDERGGLQSLNSDLVNRFSVRRRSKPDNEQLYKIMESNDVPDSIGNVSNVKRKINSFVDMINSNFPEYVSINMATRGACKIGKIWKTKYANETTEHDNYTKSEISLIKTIDERAIDKCDSVDERHRVEEWFHDSFGVEYTNVW